MTYEQHMDEWQKLNMEADKCKSTAERDKLTKAAKVHWRIGQTMYTKRLKRVFGYIPEFRKSK